MPTVQRPGHDDRLSVARARLRRMSLSDLDLDRWRDLDLAAARRIGEDVSDFVGGRLRKVETVEHLGGPLHRVRVERDGCDFALIPGGTVTLGFDLEAWKPTPEQAADYSKSLDHGYGCAPDLRAYLSRFLSPRRTVTVPTLLVAVEDEPLTAPPPGMPDALAARGLRMPTPDEWEHACGAGANTLFRWGDACPLDRVPYGDDTGPHNEPNAFGLRIAYDTYSVELTSVNSAVYGGDGGESVCGGYGTLLAWLPLATANHNPVLAEFVHGRDGADMWEDFSARPVLPL